jgi:hypothetical protein
MSDAQAVVRAACSFDPRPALALLDSGDETSRHDLAMACVAGDAEHVAELLAASPGASREPIGPFDWEPILSRGAAPIGRRSPRPIARSARSCRVPTWTASLTAAGCRSRRPRGAVTRRWWWTSSSEKAVHDVQPDVAVPRVREGLRNGADHREAERLP